MPKSKNPPQKFHYPYQRPPKLTASQRAQHQTLYHYIKSKFLPGLKKRVPLHPLVTMRHQKQIEFWKAHAKTHKYFLKFDIAKFFIHIDHSVLIKNLNITYQQLYNRKPPQKLLDIMARDLPLALQQSSVFSGLGLPLGTSLSYLMSYLYLLPLDLKINTPFVKFADDYLLFFKKPEEIERFVAVQLLPILNDLKLSIAPQKISSGAFAEVPCCYMGYQYQRGYFSVAEDKVAGFKQRIRHLCALKNHKDFAAILKMVNYQVRGFGHYYKFADVASLFERLDKTIRHHVRRYHGRVNSHAQVRVGHFVLDNQTLEDAGLVSLTIIWRNLHGSAIPASKTAKVSSPMAIGDRLRQIDTRLFNIEQEVTGIHQILQSNGRFVLADSQT
jgi:hypothetical protein